MLIGIKEAYTDRIPLKQIVLAHKIRQTNVVTGIDEQLYKEIKMALKACLAYDGIGIAANQIGINKSFFLIRENEETFRVYFNPKLKTSENSFITSKEGCLSVPSYQLLVKRSTKIVVDWQEIENSNFVLKENYILENDKARVFLHELDHLKGVSVIDKSCELNRAGKRAILTKLNQR
jgi:peptide deformylase